MENGGIMKGGSPCGYPIKPGYMPGFMLTKAKITKYNIQITNKFRISNYSKSKKK